MNSRTIEITEVESRALSNAMKAFLSAFGPSLMTMEPEKAADLLDQTNTINFFLDKVQNAFKHNKPTRKASIYAIDGGQY